jgi:uncharacterized membrane protein YdjX (TVP38/TMEM64 family)
VLGYNRSFVSQLEILIQLEKAILTKVFLFSLFMLAAASVFYFDLLNYLTLENILLLNDKLGWWAPLVFMLAFIVGEVLQVPSVLWIFFAGLIWPLWLAIPVVLLSAMLAATGAFLLARFFLDDRIIERLPTNIKKLDENIKRNPVRAVIAVRLTTFLHPLVHWALAASSIRVPAFLLGTFIGILPGTLGIVFLGQQFIDWWAEYSALIVGCALLLVFGLIVRTR